MGSKRIGLARVEALIENLKRDLKSRREDMKEEINGLELEAHLLMEIQV